MIGGKPIANTAIAKMVDAKFGFSGPFETRPVSGLPSYEMALSPRDQKLLSHQAQFIRTPTLPIAIKRERFQDSLRLTANDGRYENDSFHRGHDPKDISCVELDNDKDQYNTSYIDQVYKDLHQIIFSAIGHENPGLARVAIWFSGEYSNNTRYIPPDSIAKQLMTAKKILDLIPSSSAFTNRRIYWREHILSCLRQANFVIKEQKEGKFAEIFARMCDILIAEIAEMRGEFDFYETQERAHSEIEDTWETVSRDSIRAILLKHQIITEFTDERVVEDLISDYWQRVNEVFNENAVSFLPKHASISIIAQIRHFETKNHIPEAEKIDEITMSQRLEQAYAMLPDARTVSRYSLRRFYRPIDLEHHLIQKGILDERMRAESKQRIIEIFAQYADILIDGKEKDEVNRQFLQLFTTATEELWQQDPKDITRENAKRILLKYDLISGYTRESIVIMRVNKIIGLREGYQLLDERLSYLKGETNSVEILPFTNAFQLDEEYWPGLEDQDDGEEGKSHRNIISRDDFANFLMGLDEDDSDDLGLPHDNPVARHAPAKQARSWFGASLLVGLIDGLNSLAAALVETLKPSQTEQSTRKPQLPEPKKESAPRTIKDDLYQMAVIFLIGEYPKLKDISPKGLSQSCQYLDNFLRKRDYVTDIIDKHLALLKVKDDLNHQDNRHSNTAFRITLKAELEDDPTFMHLLTVAFPDEETKTELFSDYDAFERLVKKDDDV